MVNVGVVLVFGRSSEVPETSMSAAAAMRLTQLHGMDGRAISASTPVRRGRSQARAKQNSTERWRKASHLARGSVL